MKENLLNKNFVGIVEDNIDPDRKLRLKIRIPYLHGTKDQIPTENLPWSLPKKQNSVSSVVPELNKIINVSFPTGEVLYPEYDNVEHFDINLQNKIDTLDDKEYTKFISLCYNYNTQIFITPSEGLNIFHKKSGIILNDDGDIVIRLNGNSNSVFLGDENASQSMMLGNNWIDFFDTLIQALPTAYIDGSGMPCTMNAPLVNVINQYNILKKKFTSKNFFLSDNKTISTTDISTTMQTGDKYDTINETDEIKLVIEEQELEEQVDEIIKDENKKQIIEEKIDEQINEDDGLLHLSNATELKKFTTENINIVTAGVEDDVEISNEGTDFEDDSYFSDFYTDDNGGFTNSDNSIISNNTGPTADDYWEPQYNYPPPPATLEFDGNPTNGTVAGIRTKRKNINSGIEELDMSILPKPGMISKFLSYEQCLFSSTAKRIGDSNEPDNNDHLRNLVNVTKVYWDTTFKFFKENYGYILVLNSAYRNLRVNNAVGGSKTSQHKSGSALDMILTKDGKSHPKNERLNNLLFYYLKHKFNYFGQLIWEGNASDGPQWCHISLNNAGKTGQIFSAAGGVIKEPNSETVRILTEHNIWDPSKESKQYII